MQETEKTFEAGDGTSATSWPRGGRHCCGLYEGVGYVSEGIFSSSARRSKVPRSLVGWMGIGDAWSEG